MKMRHLLTRLFTKNDAATVALIEAASNTGTDVTVASERLQKTIDELMDRNDALTFRGRNAKSTRTQ